MKLLSEKNYNKIVEPLKQVTINKLFAQAVIERKIKGKVFVDSIETPRTFYIVHPYRMTLLFGANDNEIFNSVFKNHSLNIHNTRENYEWKQAFPNSWDITLTELYKDCSIRSGENKTMLENGVVEFNTRINFKFNPNKHRSLKNISLSKDVKIVRTNGPIFHAMKGSVVPKYFWDSEDDFLKNGVGFSLFYKDRLASTAYSSCIQDDQLELGMETIAAYRGKGFAELVCLALIDYAIANNFEPVWACRLENIGSYKLAQKVGFDPSLEIPYYRLSN